MTQGEGSFISFGVDGVPYSQVRIDIGADWDATTSAISQAVAFAKVLADEYSQTFGGPPPYEPGEPVREPVDEDWHGGGTQRAPQGGASNAPKTHSGLFCPDHPRVELVQSIDKYQKWDEGPNGSRIPAAFFCPGKENGTGTNHTIYRSKAVVPAGSK